MADIIKLPQGAKPAGTKEDPVPGSPTSRLILELGQARGLDTGPKIKDALVEKFKGRGYNIRGDNWSRYWGGKRNWPTDTYLVWLAEFFEVSVEYLAAARDPVAIVAEIYGNQEFPYAREWRRSQQIGEAPNWKWDGVWRSRIYALRVADTSLLPAYRPGTILYFQKGCRLEDLEDFDSVVHIDERRGVAQLRVITTDPHYISLSSPTGQAKPRVIPRKEAGPGLFDLLLMTYRPPLEKVVVEEGKGN